MPAPAPAPEAEPIRRVVGSAPGIEGESRHVARIARFRAAAMGSMPSGRPVGPWDAGTVAAPHVRPSLDRAMMRLRDIFATRAGPPRVRLVVNPVAAARMAGSGEVRGLLARASPWGAIAADVWGLPGPAMYRHPVRVETALRAPGPGGEPRFAVADDEAFLLADFEPGVNFHFYDIFGDGA